MKNYKITVNGTEYDVAVEEVAGGTAGYSAPVKTAAPVKKAPVKMSDSAKGSISVKSPMQGKILSIKVAVGQSVKRGEVIMLLEAMKMENEIVAPEDGVVATIDISEGASVETGVVLATLN